MEKMRKHTYREQGQTYDTDIDEALKGIEVRVMAIVEKLKENIVNGDYGVVLGIDDSGRVPALIMWNVLKHFSSKVELRFVSGRRKKSFLGIGGDSKWRKEAHDFFSKDTFNELHQTDKKVLIVEDTLVTGASISSICTILREQNIEFTVVALSGRFDTKHHVEKDLQTALVYGSDGIAPIYGKRQMSGVDKSGGVLHTKPMEEVEQSLTQNTKEHLAQGEVLHYTRSQIKGIAEQVIQQLS